MGTDRTKFIAVFKAEASEYVTVLNRGIVILEKDPHNKELLNQLGRTAHTLKGAARMMGFNRIQDVAHKIEDLFGMLEKGEMVFSSHAADAIFVCLDAIGKAIDSVAEGKEEGIAVETVCTGINAVCGMGTKQEAKKEETEMQEAEIQEEKDKKEKIEEPAPASPSPAPPPSPSSSPPQNNGREGAKGKEEGEYIRVSLNRINSLLNLIGEMVISKSKSSYKIDFLRRLSRQVKNLERTLFELESLLKDELGVSDDLIQSQGLVLRSSQEMETAMNFMERFHNLTVNFSNMREHVVKLSDDTQSEIFYLNPIIEELQQKMKEIRMLPCSTIFEAFPRMIRDIAKEQGKEVEFIVKGEETELDKKVLEAIKNPLIHLLRNAVDHGVGMEKAGTVTLSAKQTGGRVIIEVTDDGKGIDLDVVKTTALSKHLVGSEELDGMSDQEVLNIIFTNGFSTAPIITDVSGRGIGLDVVRIEIEKIKGTTAVLSEKDAGTTVRIELPLTIAIVRVLLAEVADRVWAFPTLDVEESVKIPVSLVSTIEGRMIVQVRDRSVPIVFLSEVLGMPSPPPYPGESNHEHTVVIANSLAKRVGFIVNRVLGEEEVFIKNIGPHLGKVNGVGGATIMPNGEVVVILDVQDLVLQAQMAHPAVQPRKKSIGREKKKKILVVEDSLTTRELEKTILETKGYEVETAIDGLDAMEKISQHVFDAVVSDIRMPRMDGFELCKKIKEDEKYRNIPFIFVTALSKDEEKKKGIEVGAQAYITKAQFDQGNLLDAIERLT